MPPGVTRAPAPSRPAVTARPNGPGGPDPGAPRAGLTRRELLGTALAAAALPALARGAKGPTPSLPLHLQPIAVFSKHLQWLDYREAAELAAEAGFDALDVTVRPGGHVSPERAREDLPRFAEAARAAGVAITMITTAITSADDPDAETVLEAAGALGIRHYRMGYVQYPEGRSLRQTLAEQVPRFRALADLGETLGVQASYQNHSGAALGAAIWDLLRVLEAAGSEWIGCQYDVRHGVVEGAHSWVRDLEAIAPWIRTLVAKDYTWTPVAGGLRLDHVPYGDGLVPLGRWVGELRRLGVSAPLCLHLEYLEADRDAPASGRRRRTLEPLRRDLGRLRATLVPGAAAEGEEGP